MRRSAAVAWQLLQAQCGAGPTNTPILQALGTQLLPAGSHLQQHSQAQQGSCSSRIDGLPCNHCSVRHMAGRTHKLSLKRENNAASWEAVRPFLKQHPAEQQQLTASKAADQQQPIKSAIPELPRVEQPLHHRKLGRITGPYSISRQAAFAVVGLSGSQFKVTADDVIYSNKIPGVLVNDVIELGNVLLAGTQQETIVGRPFIPGATVVAAVEETMKDAKVHVFKKKKRKGYSKLKGHRSHITALRILELRVPGMHIPAAATQVVSASSSGAQQQAGPAETPISSIRPGDRVPAVSNVKKIVPPAAGNA